MTLRIAVAALVLICGAAGAWGGEKTLGVSYEQIMSKLRAQFPQMKPTAPVDGLPRIMGRSRNGHATLEVYGDKMDLSKVSMGIILHPRMSRGTTQGLTELMYRYLIHAVPQWDRKTARKWLVDSMVEILKTCKVLEFGGEKVLSSDLVHRKTVHGKQLVMKKPFLHMWLTITPVGPVPRADPPKQAATSTRAKKKTLGVSYEQVMTHLKTQFLTMRSVHSPPAVPRHEGRPKDRLGFLQLYGKKNDLSKARLSVGMWPGMSMHMLTLHYGMLAALARDCIPKWRSRRANAWVRKACVALLESSQPHDFAGHTVYSSDKIVHKTAFGKDLRMTMAMGQVELLIVPNGQPTEPPATLSTLRKIVGAQR